MVFLATQGGCQVATQGPWERVSGSRVCGFFHVRQFVESCCNRNGLDVRNFLLGVLSLLVNLEDKQVR